MRYHDAQLRFGTVRKRAMKQDRQSAKSGFFRAVHKIGAGVLGAALVFAPVMASAQIDPVSRGLAAQALIANAPINSVPYVYNLDPANLPHWGKALGNMKAGTYWPTVLYVGDSKTMGAGAGTSSVTTNLGGAAAKNKTTWMAGILNALGYSTSTDSFFGDNAVPTALTNYPTYNTKVTFTGSGLTQTGTNFGSRPHWKIPASSTANVCLSPAGTVDTVDVWISRFGGTGAFIVKDGGSTASTVSDPGSSAFKKYTVTLLSRASGKTICIGWSSGGDIFLDGMVAYDSTTPQVNLINIGAYGSKTSDWVLSASAWDTLNAIPVVAPDLTVINLATNDMNTSNNVPVATISANIQLIITAAKQTGDCGLVMPSASTTAVWGSDGTRASTLSAIKALAKSNGCFLIDEQGLLGGRTAATANGMFFDSIHENAAAYQIEAKLHAKVLAGF